THGQIFRYDGDCCRAAAGYNVPPEFVEMWERTPIRAERGKATGQALLERRPIQIIDIQTDPEYEMHETLREVGMRTVLAVPLLRQGLPPGLVALWETEIEPFAGRQIEGDHICRPGGDRDRERAAVRRGSGAHARALRGAGAADGDLGGASGHFQLARRTGACV